MSSHKIIVATVLAMLCACLELTSKLHAQCNILIVKRP